MTNPNDPAFPDPMVSVRSGLTKREYFAAMAMTRFHIDGSFDPELFIKIAKQSVAVADALIAELAK